MLAGLAMGLVAASWSLHGLGRWDVVLVLAVVAQVAEGRSMRVSPRVEVSVSFMAIALAAVLFGPAAAALVGGAAMLHREGPLERFLIYFSGKSLAGCAAGWTALVAERGLDAKSLVALVAIAAIASVVGTGVEFFVTAITLLIRHGTRPLELWRLLRGSMAVCVALYAPVTALIAFTYGRVGVEVLAFFIVPLIAAHLSFGMHARQAQLIEELEEANERLEEANEQLRLVNISFAGAMVRALDERDKYTAGHSAAVAVYSRDIARALGLPRDEVMRIHLAALVHDIGKIGLRAELLEKRSALDDDEWAEMREHPAIGARILAEVEDYSDIALVVRSHHERWDGAGYPDGLAGDGIPRLARIIAVADSYNAMTSDRPYRAAMSTERAIQQLVLGKGTQFEAPVVDAFIEILEAETVRYQRGRGFDFSIQAQHHSVVSAEGDASGGRTWGAAVA
ncbi:MAG TPA: HD-GYP domain-containing protein [Gaiellales bacterium]|nr:HD-GYP domain-containing protein [Gaiellales bacterium]